MPHQKSKKPRQKSKKPATVSNSDSLRRAVGTLLQDADFSQVQFRSECRWTPVGLVAGIFFWCWSDARALADRWKHSRDLVAQIFGLHDLGAAYQPFMRTLVRWSAPLLCVVQARFRQVMASDLVLQWRVDGFLAFAVDGTKHETPRTESNEKRFSSRSKKKKGKKKRKHSPEVDKKATTPQIFLTLLWHMGTGLPWSWRSGNSGSSERHHLREMLPELPPGSLLIADAGFTGYELWREILKQGHQFLIRVGGNVRLLKNLGLQVGPTNRVWLWPDDEKGLPIEVRLVKIGKGSRTMWLVTSILNAAELRNDQIKVLYRRRWGIEVCHRSNKQTLEKRKLRSHTADHAVLELEWSLVALWAIGLIALLDDRKAEPRKLSVAGLIRALRDAMRNMAGVPRPGQDLYSRIRTARIDSYKRRNKSSRDYPRKKKPDKTKAPDIWPATNAQRRKYRKLLATAAPVA